MIQQSGLKTSRASANERSRLSRLLIVEDHPTDKSLLLEILEKEGLETIACSSATEALGHVCRDDISVAIVDLSLPDLNRTRLLQQLRQKRERIRVIIYTGRASYESAKEAVNLGAFAYVEKTCEFEELLREVHRALWTNFDRYALDLEFAIYERNQAKKALERAREEMELRILERTTELEQTNLALKEEIAERKKTDQALRESESRLDLAVGGATEGFWDATCLPDKPWFFQGTPLWCSPRFKAMIGVKKEESPCLLESWTSRLHPEDRDRFFSSLNAHIERNRPFDEEFRLQTNFGEFGWYRARGQAIRDDAGNVLRLAGSLQEITDRKQIEETLRKREQQLHQALEYQEAISQDLHDGVLQSCYVLGLGLELSKQLVMENPTAAVESIHDSIAQINSLMRDIRDFITGLDVSINQPRDFTLRVQEIVSKISHTQPVDISLSIGTAAAQQLTCKESMHLTYIVQEALSNSLRHGGAKTCGISLGMRGNSIALEIWDDGSGFKQRDALGCGHGLKNMAVRAQKIGGHFSLDSGQGQGARIVVRLDR
jgi:PAS domain S-box-containing protein